MTTIELAIPCVDGPTRHVKAEVYGPLCVHRAIEYGGGWRVSTLKGLGIGRAYPKRKQARAVCQELLTIEGADWEASNTHDWPETVIQQLREIVTKERV